MQLHFKLWLEQNWLLAEADAAISPREFMRRMEILGFTVRESGSHRILEHPTGVSTTISINSQNWENNRDKKPGDLRKEIAEKLGAQYADNLKFILDGDFDKILNSKISQGFDIRTLKYPEKMVSKQQIIKLFSPEQIIGKTIELYGKPIKIELAAYNSAGRGIDIVFYQDNDVKTATIPTNQEVKLAA